MLSKDPDAFLDYGVNWTAWLAEGETIAASEWEIEDGVTGSSESFTDTTTTVWVADGTVGTVYTLTNRITTSEGRIDDRSLRIQIRQR
jgi:hypothetical protein